MRDHVYIYRMKNHVRESKKTGVMLAQHHTCTCVALTVLWAKTPPCSSLPYLLHGYQD